MSRKGIVELKQRAVPGVRVGEQDCVRQVLDQPVGVRDGNHCVMNAVHDEHWLANGREVRETLASELLPIPKGHDLSLGDFRPGDRFAIFLPFDQPVDEGFARSLT